MRTIDELIKFMNWPGDVNYEELMEQKRKYVYDESGDVRESWSNNHDPDLFFSIQGEAMHLYSRAKDAFGRGGMTLDELFSLQEYLLEGLWRQCPASVYTF